MRTVRRRLLAGAVALAGHVLVLVVVLSTHGPPPLAPSPPPFESTPVELVAPFVVEPPKATHAAAASASRPAGPKTPAPPRPAPVRKPAPMRVARQPPPSDVAPRLVPPSPPEPPSELAVSASALAAATTAESEAAGGGGLGGFSVEGAGGGNGGAAGGRCDMVRRLQQALRNDASVQAAVAHAPRAPGFVGRPLMVWNGDWVRHGDEEGKGLASVRQAIAVEVAFAPRSCRIQSMRGLVLLSLTDAPGAPRLVLGAGAWRWSDLTLAR